MMHVASGNLRFLIGGVEVHVLAEAVGFEDEGTAMASRHLG
jgi:hypothetical protein